MSGVSMPTSGMRSVRGSGIGRGRGGRRDLRRLGGAAGRRSRRRSLIELHHVPSQIERFDRGDIRRRIACVVHDEPVRGQREEEDSEERGHGSHDRASPGRHCGSSHRRLSSSRVCAAIVASMSDARNARTCNRNAPMVHAMSCGPSGDRWSMCSRTVAVRVPRIRDLRSRRAHAADRGGFPHGSGRAIQRQRSRGGDTQDLPGTSAAAPDGAGFRRRSDDRAGSRRRFRVRALPVSRGRTTRRVDAIRGVPEFQSSRAEKAPGRWPCMRRRDKPACARSKDAR